MGFVMKIFVGLALCGTLIGAAYKELRSPEPVPVLASIVQELLSVGGGS